MLSDGSDAAAAASGGDESDGDDSDDDGGGGDDERDYESDRGANGGKLRQMIPWFLYSAH